MSKLTCKDRPCPSCPYRKDAPRGLWAIDHYELLPRYDGEMGEQAAKGAFGLFNCHYNTGDLCRGWLDTHGADNLLALRLSRGGPIEGYDGEKRVDVYESGQAVLDANLPFMDNPERRALEIMPVLVEKFGKVYESDPIKPKPKPKRKHKRR